MSEGRTLDAIDVDALKARARAGDRAALQRLRDIGFFQQAPAAPAGFAASHAQKRLWILDRMIEGGSTAYNIAVALRLDGTLDSGALHRALDLLVQRHESLRTALRDVDGEPRQVIEPAPRFDLPLVDLSAAIDVEAAVRESATAEAGRPFDLSQAPLLRATVLRLADAHHVLLLTAHHVAFDQWSAGVFVRELGEVYRALRAGEPPALEALPLQYKEFAAWQNARLSGPPADAHRRYWRGQLAGPIPPLTLPSDRPRPRAQTFAGAVISRPLGAAPLRHLETLARARGASMVMAFAAALKALFHRYTGQEDIVIGTTIAGRDRRELAGQIGFYVNSLALRDRVDSQASFIDLLDRVRATATDAYEHQEYPFDRLVDELGLVRDLSRSPLFDVMLIVGDDPEPSLSLEGLRASLIDNLSVAAKYDLTMDFARTASGWIARMIYNTDLYDEARIVRLVDHLESLVADATARPDAPIGALNLLPDRERDQLRAISRGPIVTRPEQTIVGFFDEVAERTPDRPAVTVPARRGAPTRSVTYRELAARARALADHLSARNLGGRGSTVAVLLDRGDALIASLLGVMKSGAAYLPLDPALPSERLTWLIDDAGATAIITSDEPATRLPVGGPPVVVLDGWRPGPLSPGVPGPEGSGLRQDPPSPDDLAYLIYTSGSTGVPKGVEVAHRSFVNMARAQMDAFEMRPTDVALQFASCSFDASLSEVFMALLSGACLLCPHEDELKDPAELRRLLREHGVTVATLPPPYIRALGFPALTTLRVLITAGEAAMPDRGSFSTNGRKYWNAYGPTEFSVCATMGLVPAGVADPQPVPIGRPIANSDVLILEAGSIALRPFGVPGELCLGGAGLARGYRHREGLTAATFVPHPFRPGERLYRTGDLARWREDGTIEFLGRLDHQIKIHGHRIEPGEIEAVLRAQPGVRDAAVVDRDGGLVAFLAPSGSTIDPEQLRQALTRWLPDYMVPDRLVALADLPRLPSGKIDRAALPSTASTAIAASTPPGTDVERGLAAIWQEILGVPSVGIHDRFLDLGGNSMKAILMVSRVLRDLGARLPVRKVFEEGTIALLAATIDHRPGVEPIPRIPAAPDYAVSHAQRRLWTIDRMGEGAGAYNVPGAIRLVGSPDPDAVRAALKRLASRHESLRTTLTERDGVPRQVVHEDLPLDFAQHDLRSGTDPETDARVAIEADIGRPFDLERGPLFRTRMYRTAPDTWVLYLNLHHLISDGWSLAVFFRDLVALFSPGATPLAALPVHYKDFAAWQNARSSGGPDRDYWRRVLDGPLPTLSLPADRPRPAVRSFRGGAVTLTLDAALSGQILDHARARGATMVATWLALFYALVHRYTGADDLIVGMPATFRDHPDLDDQVGFFVNMLPLRFRVQRDDHWDGLIARVKTLLHESIEHRCYPYDLLVEELQLRRDMSRNPLFDVAISVAERDRSTPLPSEFHASPFLFASRASKFDLTLFAAETDDGRWDLTFEYDSDLFDEARIERLGRHLVNFARGLVATPGAALESIDFLDPAEHRRLSEDWASATSAYPRDRSIGSVFEAQAARTPELAAAISDDGCLTYRELNARANGVARCLEDAHTRAEEPIGVLLEPSSRIAVALLGILKAHNAYVPLEPSAPTDRTGTILQDAGIRRVISSAALIAHHAPRHPGVQFIDVETLGAHADSPRSSATGSSLAYVMYTSGSTGRPKGALIDHRAVLRLVVNANYVTWNTRDRVLQAGSLAFDASTFEIWGPLLNGAAVVFPPPRAILDPTSFGQLIARQEITTLFVTTSLFNQLVDHSASVFAGVRQLITGGERCSPDHFARLREAMPELRLIHAYGPTESTTFTTCYDVHTPGAHDIPIGRPICNTDVYVLARDLTLAPIGVDGEICIGGDGLARGYLHEPALTAERFVPHPFRSGARLYRTGDLGRWRADGLLEIVGRLDDQVKIRGYRVEPGEIEIRLREHPLVADAAVVSRLTPIGTKELIAYVASPEPIVIASLRAHLRERLPEYMVPALVVQLERLPLTPNGKVDRRALPAPASAPAAPGAARPANDNERLLASIWGELLGHADVSVDANYFEIGGDSIRAIQIASRLRRAGWAIDVREIFECPTIAELARRLRPAADVAPTPQLAVAGPIALTPIQQWYLDHHDGRLRHFNQAVLLRPRRRIDPVRLRAVIARIQETHDALRVKVEHAEHGPLEGTIEPADLALRFEVVDLKDAVDTAAILQQQLDDWHAAIDLRNPPAFRVALLHLPDADRVWLAAHHFAVDAVSWRILIEDLEIGYAQADRGASIELGPATAPFREWVQEIGAFASSDDARAEAGYWMAIKDLAQTVPAVGGVYGDALTVHSELSLEETQTLLGDAHRAYHTEITDLLLVALGRALPAGEDALVDLEGHGREPLLRRLDLTRTVGWFTSVFPFGLETAATELRAAIRRTKERIRGVPRRGAGYGAIRYRTGLLDRARRTPRISFNYLGQFDSTSEAGLFDFAPEGPGTAIAADGRRAHAWEVCCVVTDGQLHASVTCPASDRDAAQRAVALFTSALRDIIQHCLGRQPELTPADFSLGGDGSRLRAQDPSPGLSLEEYDDVLARRHWRPEDVQDIVPPTPMQESLLLESLIDDGTHAYLVQLDYGVEGKLDPGIFERAWEIVARRHPVLRSAFAHEDLAHPLVVVLRDRKPEFAWIDLRALTPADQDARIHQERRRDLERGFDFERGALTRFLAFRVSEARWRIVWSYHHILLDGWSLGIVLRDLGLAYRSLAAGSVADFPPAVSPRALVQWRAHQDHDRAIAWWRQQLDGYESPARLPGARTSRDGQPHDPRDLVVELDAATTARLRDQAGRLGATTATIAQAAWSLLLARYNRTDDVVSGSIVSGRPHDLEGAEEIVGALINAVPVRVRLASDTTIGQLVRRVQQDLLAAEPHQHLPLAEVVATTSLGRDLFTHLLIVENYPVDRQVASTPLAEGVRIDALDAHDRTHYDFGVTLVPGDRLLIQFQFDAHVHTPAEVDRIARHYVEALRAFAGDPDRCVAGIDILPAEERARVVNAVQPAAVDGPDGTVVDRFEDQAARTPDYAAIECEGMLVTYRELAEQVRAFAETLHTVGGFGRGDLTAVMLERSALVPAVLLAVLRAGGAYVPVDPDLPEPRIRYVLDDAQVRLVIGDRTSARHLRGWVQIAQIEHAVVFARAAQTPSVEALGDGPRPEDAAYVMYTSGSTGQPKGVVIPHRALASQVDWFIRAFGIGPDDRFLHKTPLSFDSSVEEIYGSLLSGACVVVAKPGGHLDPDYLCEAVVAERVTLLDLVPAQLAMINEAGGLPAESALRAIFVGGEALDAALLARLPGPTPFRVYNLYGPTETCVNAAAWEWDGRVAGTIPIGHPVANTRIYVLDDHLRPSPLGVPGEICLGGRNLAIEYLRRPELTAERFIESPHLPGERLYRTGDLGRWSDDGVLEYLGRIDEQVKIRGHRIECGEVEAALRAHPAVVDAAAVACPSAGTHELVAFVVAAPDDRAALRQADLRTFLAATLPDPMVPSRFVVLDRLPVSPSGKIDRRALTTLAASATSSTSSKVARVAARDDREAAIARIWQRVLDVDEIGVHDNFFERGGHSLKAMQIVSRIRRDLGLKITLREFFDRPTVAELAALAPRAAADSDVISPAPLRETYSLSHAQQRLWLLHHVPGGEIAYNMPTALVIDGGFDAAALQRAFAALVDRHEALRTAFVLVDGEPRQRILPHVEIVVRRVDLRGVADRDRQARALAEEDAQTPFDLSVPPLLRLTVIDLSDAFPRHLVLFTMHHIVGDGWSEVVLMREVEILYHAFREGRPNPLAPLRIQYKDFAEWQTRQAFAKDEAWWLARLAGLPQRIALPYDFPSRDQQEFRGAVIDAGLDPERTAALRAFAAQRNMTLAHVILALFQLALYRFTGQRDLCVGMGVAGRNQRELEGLIGFFVNILPIRTQFSDGASLDRLLDEVSRSATEAFDHQDYPFDLLVRRLHAERAATRQPLLNVMFAFQNFADVQIDVGVGRRSDAGDGHSQAFDFSFGTSKFDLTLFVADERETLRLILEYDSGLFLEASARKQLDTVIRFVEMAVAGGARV